MNQRSLLSQFLWISLLSFLAGGLLLPRYYRMPYPKPLGSQTPLTPKIQKGGINAISENKPEVVLIGDSILYTGVEDSVFSEALGLKAYSVAVPGSGAAVWYLIFKNVVLAAEHRPRYVVMLFRDTLLTVPNFRVTGHYFTVVDEYAGADEPLLMERAYINVLNPLEKLAERYFPPYSARWNLREALNRRARYLPARLILSCDQACADEAYRSIFNNEEMNNLVFNNRAAYDEGILYSRQSLNFEAQIPRSFLPAMVELARQNGVTLVFVRMKNLDYPVAASETPALQKYIRALSEYFAVQENVRYLDLSHDDAILPEYFEADGFHFNLEGKAAFSLILAERLKPILEK